MLELMQDENMEEEEDEIEEVDYFCVLLKKYASYYWYHVVDM